MKKNLFAALLWVPCIYANAQVTLNGHLYITPNAFTKDGKAIPISYNWETDDVKILDSNLAVTKQFTVANLGKYEKTYTETAIIEPTEAVMEWSNQYDVFLNDGSRPKASSVAELIQFCKDNISNSDNWVTFTDSEGRKGCCRIYDCFDHERFGNSYPEEYYAIIEGSVWHIRCAYKYAVDAASIESAEWILDGEPQITALENIDYGCRHLDYDNNTAFDLDIVFTQTLYNDDDKWEYIAPLYGELEISAKVTLANGSQFLWKREVCERPSNNGLAIYNEDGTKVAEITHDKKYEYFCVDYVAILDDKVYLICTASYPDGSSSDAICYLYDPASSDIRQISSSKSDTFFNMEGRTIHFNTEGNADAALFGMNGIKIASAKGGIGSTLCIDASNIPAGVYNVALMKHGKVTQARKVILK